MMIPINKKKCILVLRFNGITSRFCRVLSDVLVTPAFKLFFFSFFSTSDHKDLCKDLYQFSKMFNLR